MVIYKSNYCEIIYLTEKNFMEVIFTVAENDIRFDEKKLLEENLVFKSKIEQHKPVFLLVNTKHYYYNIPVHFQEWIAINIIQNGIKLGMKRNAVLLSDEIVSLVSAEQTRDEGISINSEAQNIIQMFADRNKALKWLDIDV